MAQADVAVLSWAVLGAQHRSRRSTPFFTCTVAQAEAASTTWIKTFVTGRTLSAGWHIGEVYVSRMR